jgi:hypothetical protein
LSNYVSSSRVPRHARLRRQIEEAEAAANPAEEQKSEEHKSEEGTSDLTKEAEQEPADDTEKGSQSSAENSENTSKHVPDTDEPKEGEQEDHKSDTTPEQHVELVNEAAKVNGTKSGKFIFDDETPHYYHPHQKARNVEDPNPDQDPDQNTDQDPDQNTDQDPDQGQETDPEIEPRAPPMSTAESDCPVEGGAVYTKWGTVSLGTVLAGLAAGLFPQAVQLSDLVRRSPPSVTLPPDLLGAVIDNRFAATLVGDLSEAVLEQGPRRPNNIKIGLNGGWNSTVAPRWYFQRERDGREMTDAEIRGGLDGLVMGTFITEWRQQLQGTELRLSQLLTMYYSEDGAFTTQNRACQRKDLFSVVAPNNRLEDETYRFAVVLDQQSITSASVDSTRLRAFAGTAVRQLSSYIPGMDDRTCSITGNVPQNMSLFTNVTVVIDTAWRFEDIKEIVYQLAVELELSEFGSRLTVLDGRNGSAFITDAMFSVDFDRNFTRSAYEARERGMDIPQLLERELLRSNEGLLNAEAMRSLGGGRSTVILFIPQDPIVLNNNDLTIARDRIRHFRECLPDVRFLYLAPTGRDNYRELVGIPDTDIITPISLATDADKIAAISQVIDRIKQVPLRLFNPTCGASWSGQNYDSGDFTHSVKRMGVKYHRLHQNYFFGVGSALITVLSPTSDLTVCHSRTSEFPDRATSDVTCAQTQNGNVEIRLENACEGHESISACPSLFISVASMTNTRPTTSCTNECALPTNIQYTVRNQRLGCMAGVGHLLSNPQFIFLTAALIFLMNYLKVGS